MTMFHWKLLGGLGLLLVVIGSIAYGNHWKGKASRYNSEAVSMYEAVKSISANAKLERPDTVLQIQELGRRLVQLQVGLDQCSTSVRHLAADSEKQQREAQAALSREAARVKEAKGAVARLEASAREPRSDVCLSDEVKERWQ